MLYYAFSPAGSFPTSSSVALTFRGAPFAL
jgi:hypothetical protein